MKNILFSLVFIFPSLCSYTQQTSNDTLHWSASRKLTWDDFKGKTANKTGVLGHASMEMQAKFKKGLKATTSVVSIFDRKVSFVSASEKTAQMLSYYQTMFDLHEAESIKLRKVYKETKLGLDPEKVFQEKYNAALQKLAERIDLYQEETEEGTNAGEIERWSKLILQELKVPVVLSK